MSNISECLTYPDLLSCLDGSPGRCPAEYFKEHLYWCVKCRARFETIKDFIVDEPTWEELLILDNLENSPRNLNLRDLNPLSPRDPRLVN